MATGLVSASTFERIGRRLRNDVQFGVVPSGAALLRSLVATEHSTLVIDPDRLREGECDRVVVTLQDRPHVVILYASLTTLAMRNSVSLARVTSARLLFQGDPESIRTIQRWLSASVSSNLAPSLLLQLEPVLRMLPVPLLRNVRRMVLDLDGCNSAAKLASLSGMTRRTLERRLAIAGIPSVRLLLNVCRFVRFQSVIENAEITVAHAAKSSGLGCSRTLERQCMEVTGHSVRQLRCMSSDAWLVDALVSAMTGGTNKLATA